MVDENLTSEWTVQRRALRMAINLITAAVWKHCRTLTEEDSGDLFRHVFAVKELAETAEFAGAIEAQLLELSCADLLYDEPVPMLDGIQELQQRAGRIAAGYLAGEAFESRPNRS